MIKESSEAEAFVHLLPVNYQYRVLKEGKDIRNASVIRD